MMKRLYALLAGLAVAVTIAASPAFGTSDSHRLSKLSKLCNTFTWHHETIYSTPVGTVSCASAVSIGHKVAAKKFSFNNPRKFGSWTCHTTDEAQRFSGHLVDCERGRFKGITIDRVIKVAYPNVACRASRILRAGRDYFQDSSIRVVRHLCINGVAIAAYNSPGTYHGKPYAPTYLVLVPTTHRNWYGEIGLAQVIHEPVSYQLEGGYSLASFYRLHRYVIAHKSAGKD